jgi:hypothetical protein
MRTYSIFDTAGWDISYSTTPDGSLLFGALFVNSADKNVGIHAASPSGLCSNQQGYDILYVDGSLVITPASLTVSANGDGKFHDGIAYSGGNGVSYSGFGVGDNCEMREGENADRGVELIRYRGMRLKPTDWKSGCKHY